MGTILDVLVDLRVTSPSFRKTDSFVLDAKDCVSVFIPPGVAHGYGSLSEVAAIVSSSTEEYRPDLEVGIFCRSASFDWPLDYLILSKKDRALPHIENIDDDFLTACFPEK